MINKLSQKSKIFCLIPTHNRLKKLKIIINKLQAQTYKNLQIVVIDDGCNDGTPQYLKTLPKKKIKILKGDGNLWWGGAMNAGIKYALSTAKKDDYVLFLNDDVEFDKKFIFNQISYLKKNKDIILAPMTKDIKTKKSVAGGVLINFFTCSMTSAVKKKQEYFADTAPARGVIFSINILKNVGYINTKFYRQGVGDLDFFLRASCLGYKIIFSKKIILFTEVDTKDSLHRKKVVLKNFLQRYILKDSKGNFDYENIFLKIFLYSLNGPYYLRFWAFIRVLFFGLIRKII